MALVQTIEDTPDNSNDHMSSLWQTYLNNAENLGVQVPDDPQFLKTLYRVWGASQFVAQACIRYPGLLTDLLSQGDLHRAYQLGEYALVLKKGLKGAKNDLLLHQVLRHFRTREMVRIAWRDIAGWADLNETLTELSWLADACVEQALTLIHRDCAREFGRPVSEKGDEQSLIVLGMGKLGGHELNFSSDIDLIFFFREDGDTRGRRSVSNQQFFRTVGQRLIAALNNVTEQGIVYRVDMRLRPYGDSGPLVMSFDAAEEYYQSQARDWERYAMIKARPIAGNAEDGVALMQMLRPFVYRRYLDFAAFESLRDMKAMIEEELQQGALETHIKLGRGGIREVEFIVQAFQLIRGGRDASLRCRQLLPTLQLLSEKQLLPEYEVSDLDAAYRFLRRTENRIQAWQDHQTHTLPESVEARQALTDSMGYDSWDDFTAVLEQHRAHVHDYFEKVFASPQAQDETIDADLTAVWQQTDSLGNQQQTLKASGYTKVDVVLAELAQFRESTMVRSLLVRGQQRLNRLIPLLIGAAAATDTPDIALFRSLALLEQVGQRSSYLLLLIENPMALAQMVRLLASSTWILAQLSQQPVLFDELLDPRSLYVRPEKSALEAELDGVLGFIEAGDLEEQMEALRHFRVGATLRVAAGDISEKYDTADVGVYLTMIAEVVVSRVLRLAYDHLVAEYGAPMDGHRKKAQRSELGFAVIGYGKLGGRELGYSSDLDLVFLYESSEREGKTAGKKKVPNAVFFARLGQRMIHIMNTFTPSGILYEVDMRLRPSGASGLLVTDVEAFEFYQKDNAWTWEHQALVRARAVAGSPTVMAQFESIREAVLSKRRDPDKLRKDVLDMRLRMRKELEKRRRGHFDLKQAAGAITDIEFMVQYTVLLCARQWQELLGLTANSALLAEMARLGLIEPADATCLQQSFLSYCATVRRNALQELPAMASEAEFASTRDDVRHIWANLIESEQ